MLVGRDFVMRQLLRKQGIIHAAWENLMFKPIRSVVETIVQ